MPDLESKVHWLNARLHIIVAWIVSLLAAVAFGLSAGEGDFRMIYVALLMAAVVAVMGMLGDKYWLLVPFSLTAQLPAIPVLRKMVEFPEIVITACTVTFACRFALKRQKFTLFQSAWTPILLYIGWVAVIFVKNPVGLDAMGAETGGARFYAKLLLTLASFLIVVNQRITERDCRTILILALVGSSLGSISNTLLYFFAMPSATELSGLDPFSYYGWQQHIATVPLMLIMLLLARYRPSELLSFNRLGFCVLLIVCCLLVLVSGKRAALATIPLCLIASAMIWKEYRFVFLFLGGAVVGFTIIIAFHGTLFELPLTAQRALSWLPGRWDASLADMEGGKDTFREQLRELAMDKIKADPWVGTGYGVDRRIMGLIAATPNQSEKLILQMAQGSAWHNTWLGYAADFGIPASALQAVIYGYIAWLCWRLFRRLPEGSMMQTMVLYAFLFTIRDIGGSHHAGHSSLGPFDRWWMYGVVISLALHLKAEGARRVQAPAEDAAAQVPAHPGRKPGVREPLAARGEPRRLTARR